MAKQTTSSLLWLLAQLVLRRLQHKQMKQTILMSCCRSGPFYVMMAPQDVLQSTGLGQRTLVPRSGIVPKIEPGTRVTRDDRRRATHNEGLFD